LPFLLYQIGFLGNGMTIGLNAVLHVILSHGVAIGVVGIIALAEYLAIRRGDPAWEDFAGRALRAAVITITGIGAITGVGIWFTTSALNPRGIGALLRVFFWPWFTEWIVFSLELLAILYYFSRWDRWTGERRRRRWRFGALYVLLGSLSAVLITGIMGFMLTSDGWPGKKTLASAFFNPTFLPQTFFRLAFSFALGALFASVFLLFRKFGPEFRAQALRPLGWILSASLVMSVLSGAWYLAVVPSRFKTLAVYSVLTSHLSQRPEVFWLANLLGLLVLAAFAASSLGRSRALAKVLAIPALLLMIGLVAEFERVREFIRGPYILPGYMYSNQVLLAEEGLYREKGLLDNSPWFALAGKKGDETAEGLYIFKQNCSVCHTIGGINSIADRVRGRTRDGIEVILNHTQEMVPFMAPFSGTDEERRTLAGFLFKLGNGDIKLGPSSRPFRSSEGVGK
jgi:mono/diheme cytochrome c family protein